MKILLFWITVCFFILFGAAVRGVYIPMFFQVAPAIMIFCPLLTYVFFRLGLTGSYGFSRRLLAGAMTSDDRNTARACSFFSFIVSIIAVCICAGKTIVHWSDGADEVQQNITLIIVSAMYGCLPVLIMVPLKSTEK